MKFRIIENKKNTQNKIIQPEWDNVWYIQDWLDENVNFDLFLQYYGIEEKFVELCRKDLSYFTLFNNFINTPEILTKMFVFLNNIKNRDNQTPLYRACSENDLELVKILLENEGRASVNIKSKYDNTSLISIVCSNDNLEMVKILLENGAKKDINVKNKYKQTLLYWACNKNNFKIVKLLLENGAKKSINVITDSEETPLHAACWNNNPEIIKLLLDNGADKYYNVKLFNILVDKPEIVKLLINYK